MKSSLGNTFVFSQVGTLISDEKTHLYRKVQLLLNDKINESFVFSENLIANYMPFEDGTKKLVSSIYSHFYDRKIGMTKFREGH